jgi:hypothetical protein
VFGLDGSSLAATLITSGGHIVDPADIAVGGDGSILIAIPSVGVVRVDPATGNQSILASVESLGGGSPHGILAANGGAFVAMQGSDPPILRLHPDGSVAGVVSTGGLLTHQAGMALGADGGLYVCETIAVGWMSGGSIVRVDPVSGAQSLIASGEPLHGPFHAAFAPDGWLWSVQRGHLLHERRGGVVRTRVSDGFSEPVEVGFNFASGIAIRADGLTLVADCAPVHNSCQYPYSQVFPDGPRLNGISGAVAVVPDIATHPARITWGRVKTMYR